MDKPNWDNIFNDQKFIKSYRTGEKVTGVFGKALVDQSTLITDAVSHPDQPIVVLDNACGTGVISSILQQELSDKAKENLQLTCGDFADGMLEYTRRRVESDNWVNVEVTKVDAQDTKLPSAHYTHVFTSFAYMALPRSLDALNETTRIIQPGGTIAFTTWIEPGWVSVVKEAIARIPSKTTLPWPDSEEFLSLLSSGKWHSVEWIEHQLKMRGYSDINVNSVTKVNALPVPDFLDMAMFMVPVVIEQFWSANMKLLNEGNIRPTLEKYLIDTYGENGEVAGDWTAIVSTARKAGKET